MSSFSTQQLLVERHECRLVALAEPGQEGPCRLLEVDEVAPRDTGRGVQGEHRRRRHQLL